MIYQIQIELDIFSMQRVYEFLATQSWWRTVSSVGQSGIGGHYYSVGIAYAHQDVKFRFDPQSAEFVVHDSQEVEIKRIKPSPSLIFLTDGHQIPESSKEPGFLRETKNNSGMIVGVGNIRPVPIPKYDDKNIKTGFD